jgi:hypothetical protein
VIAVDPPSILAAREHVARARDLCQTRPITAAWHLANARLFRCDWPDSADARVVRTALERAAELAAEHPAHAIKYIDLADHHLAMIYAHQTGAMI